jgi:hypothetical protein
VHINVDGDKIDLVIPEADEWVEGIGMTAYEMYNNNRIQFESIQVLSSNKAVAVGHTSRAIERHF